MRGRGRMERTDRDKRSFCSFIREVFVEGSTLGEEGRMARKGEAISERDGNRKGFSFLIQWMSVLQIIIK